MEKLSDAELILQYRNGNRGAFEIVVHRYITSIYHFIFRLIGNSHDAEDITQEVFVKLWKNIKKFDPQKNVKAWVFTIAKNATRDFFKKKKTLSFSEFDGEYGESHLENIVDTEPLPLEIVIKKEHAQDIERALSILPIRYRLVLILYFNDQFNFREIGEILEEPLHTVKSRYRRALLLLRKSFPN